MGGFSARAVPRPWGATPRSNASTWANRSTCRCDSMRPLFLLLFGAASAWAQLFSYGVRAGVPLNNFLDAAKSQQFAFNSNGSGTLAGVVTSNSATANAWEFPLLAKYRFSTKMVHPYVDAGVAWDTLSGLKQAITRNSITTSTSSPAELNTTATRGFVMGAGLSVKVL